VDNPISILIVIAVLGMVLLAFAPDARIARTLKAGLRRLVLHPKVRLYLNLDPIAPPVSLRGLTNTVGSWTSETFVQAGGIGACNHIVLEAQELKEILQKILDTQARGETVDPQDQYNMGLELADLQILIMDIAYCRHVDLTDATLLKHYINTLRKWSAPDENGVQHHIEEKVEGPTFFRTREQKLQLLKRFPGMGKAKLAAIIAEPDATIVSALNGALDAAPDEGFFL